MLGALVVVLVALGGVLLKSGAVPSARPAGANATDWRAKAMQRKAVDSFIVAY